MKNIMEERNLIVFHKTHTCSSLCKDAVPMGLCFQVVIETHEKHHGVENLIVFPITHTCSSFCKEAVPI